MKKLLFVSLSLVFLMCEPAYMGKKLPKTLITVKFDPSFINAANGKEAIYKFTPFYTSRDEFGTRIVRSLDESDILIILNKDNKAGNHSFKLEIKGKQERQQTYAGSIGSITEIDKLNGGFTFGFTVACIVKLVIEAITGPLVIKKAIPSTEANIPCANQTFVVKVENGQFKIDREEKN